MYILVRTRPDSYVRLTYSSIGSGGTINDDKVVTRRESNRDTGRPSRECWSNVSKCLPSRVIYPCTTFLRYHRDVVVTTLRDLPSLLPQSPSHGPISETYPSFHRVTILYMFEYPSPLLFYNRWILARFSQF